MKPFLAVGVALVCAMLAVAGDAVGNGETTNAVSFGGFPGPYSYQRAVSVNYNNGNPSCPLGTFSTDDGPLAPLTTESHHIFRGPLNLLQFAVYQAPTTPSNSTNKRSTESTHRLHRDRHLANKRVHRHLRREQLQNEEHREHGAEVTANIHGDVVTFEDTWDSPPSPAVAPRDEAEITATINGQIVSWSANPPPAVTVINTAGGQPVSAAPSGPVHSEVNSGRTTYSSAVATICPSSTATQVLPSTSSQGMGSQPSATPAGKGSWSRVSYFNAGSQKGDNIAFTANNNMTIEDFGFLPSWVAANGKDKATGPSMLSSSGFIPDNYEVIVSTNALCSAEDTQGGCSVVTPGAIAHHGWSGDRVVLAEYQMPQSTCGSECTNQFNGGAANTNLPAWWSLPSTTINIGQYGFSFSTACTGWTSGSGELDIHEILTGNEPSSIGYASLHMNGHYSGSPPQGFARPDGAGAMKMAVIMSGNQFHIQVLESSIRFGKSLGQDTVNGWLSANLGTPAETRTGKGAIKASKPAYSADTAAASFAVILG